MTAAVINILDMVSVALIVGAVGLKSRLGMGLDFVRAYPVGAARSMLAMFVAIPAFALLVTSLLPLERSVTLALLALSVSPMPPILPIMEKQVGGTPAYIAGTLLLAPLVALIAIPLFIWIAGGTLGRSVDYDPVAVLEILIVTLGAPLVIGLLINHHAPATAARLVRHVNWVGAGLLAIVGAVVLIAAFPAVLDALGNGTLLVILAISVFGLVAGHLAGGPHPGNRRALALMCSQRHPGVAMAIILAAFPDEAQTTSAAVLIHVMVSSAIAVPYSRWRSEDR